MLNRMPIAIANDKPIIAEIPNAMMQTKKEEW
jgi:hypothetical protein